MRIVKLLVSSSRAAYSDTASGVKASSARAISSIGRTLPRKYQSEANDPERLMLDSWDMISELFRPGSHGVKLVERHSPVAQSDNFGQHHVQGLLRPVG